METVSASTRRPTMAVARFAIGAAAFSAALVGAYIVVMVGDLVGGLPLAGGCAVGVLASAVYTRGRISHGAPILWGAAFGVTTISLLVYMITWS